MNDFKLLPGHVLVMRTCASDLTSHNKTFQYPLAGRVSAPDWDPTPKCGGGLHGCLWGVGNSELLDWSPDAKWLLIDCLAENVIKIDEQKVKFKEGEIVLVGDRKEVTDMIYRYAPPDLAIIGVTQVTDKQNAVQTAGDSSTQTAGSCSTQTAGYSSNITTGNDSYVTAGQDATITHRWYDYGQNKYRVAVFVIGDEPGNLSPNQKYHFLDGIAKKV